MSLSLYSPPSPFSISTIPLLPFSIASVSCLPPLDRISDAHILEVAIFMATILPAVVISAFLIGSFLAWAQITALVTVEPVFIMARMTFLRESSSKMYSEVVFAATQLAAETPLSIFCCIVFFFLFYYPIGFNFATSRAGFQFAMILVVEMWAVTLCVSLSS